MSKVFSLLAALLVFSCITQQATAAPLPGHSLPQGELRNVREREIDVSHLATDLRVNLEQRTVSGSATITFTPLPPVISLTLAWKSSLE